MARHRNFNWNLPQDSLSWTQATVAVLMDIRDELRETNCLLNCYRVQRMFSTIERINKKLKPLRKRKSK
jgi:hypothetical protein